MPAVFAPRINWRDAYRETWAYRTDVQRSYDDTEQRRQLRIIPTRQDSYTVSTLAARQSGALDALLYGGQTESWAVPFWPHATLLTAAATAGSAVALAVASTTDRDFVVNGYAVLYRDDHTTELCTVSAVGASSVTVATLATNWPAGTLVIPARLARLASSLTTRRVSTYGSDLPVTFDYEHGTDPGVSTPASPAVFTVARFNRREDASDRLTASRDRIDNLTYTFADYARGSTPIGERTTLSLWLPGRDAVADLRAWYFGLKGALTAFWLPTYQMDLSPVADTVSGVSSLIIRSCGYTARLFPHESRRHLAFITPAHVITHRRVTASVDNGDGTETLTLDGSSGGAVYPGAGAGLISFLLYVRLAEDPLTITWDAAIHAEATLAVVELPRQTPTAV